MGPTPRTRSPLQRAVLEERGAGFPASVTKCASSPDAVQGHRGGTTTSSNGCRGHHVVRRRLYERNTVSATRVHHGPIGNHVLDVTATE